MAVAGRERVVQVVESILRGAEGSIRLTTVITLSTATTTADPEVALPAPARHPVTLTTTTMAVLVVMEAAAEVEAEAVREAGGRPVNVVMSATIADVNDRARQAARLVRVATRA
jgi:hypothetical protein